MKAITFNQFNALNLKGCKSNTVAKIGDYVVGISMGDGWDAGKVIKVLNNSVHVEFGGELKGVISLPKKWSQFGPMKSIWQFSLYPVSAEVQPTATTEQPTTGTSKKDLARAAYDSADKSLSAHAVAVLIANQLGITTSNAAYYVACFTGKR